VCVCVTNRTNISTVAVVLNSYIRMIIKKI